MNAAEFSRYYRRMAPQLEAWSAPRIDQPDAVQMSAAIQAACQAHGLGAGLRVARQALMCRLIELELSNTPVDQITGAVSRFAELSLARVQSEIPAARALLIAGMGKLGAGELNVSSDIDIVYLFDESKADQSAEALTRAARECTKTLNESTAHGFVFRVDTRLRPNGEEGPTVCSLDMLEQYFTVQGRPWERFAWLRARLVGAPAAAQSVGYFQATVLPFVYRRYLDYGMIDSLRALHAQVRSDAQRRAAKASVAASSPVIDIKRSRGGIRELEFFVQLLQLVRGGLAPELREQHTRLALARLAEHEQISAALAADLDRAYSFLRRLENRIQFMDDAQTHDLPQADADIERLTHSFGFSTTCDLYRTLDKTREVVAAAFDSLLGRLGEKPRCTGSACGQKSGRAQISSLLDSLDDSAAGVLRQLTNFEQSAAGKRLHAGQVERLHRILLRSIRFAHERRSAQASKALGAWLDWLFAYSGRGNYLAFFDEHPSAIARLLKLFEACDFAARYLRRSPGVIDELIAQDGSQRFDSASFRAALQARLDAVARSYGGDVEPLMDSLRHAYQLEVFRIVMREIEAGTPVEQVSDDLSALADATLAISLQCAWKHSSKTAPHGQQPKLAVIGYGKLGSKELGYMSDLDLVLIYDDPAPEAVSLYTAFAKRWINWLTAHTGAGELFEIDTRLRPNGNAGLLVTSLEAFNQYQLGRAENAAWVWEHQALTKARFCAGDADIGAAFEQTRREVLSQPRERASLYAQVREMRERMHAGHPIPAGRFDLKHGAGGLVDLEFAVQALILAHARTVPTLLANAGNLALLGRAANAGLVSEATATAAAAAYRALRGLQHAQRLAQAGADAAPKGDSLESERAAIGALWLELFGAPR